MDADARPSTEQEMISLRAELARALAKEQRYRGLLDAAPDAIVVVDRNGTIVLVNTQTEDLFGYQRDELLGRPIEILVPVAMHAQHRKHRDAFLSSPSVRPMGAQLDLFGQHKNGHTIPVEICLSPIRTADGDLVSAAIRDSTERRMVQAALRNARDELERRVHERTAELESASSALQIEMADRQKAEQALYQAQKMEAVGQLTGGVAHDFNNLLTVVMGNLNILAKRLGEDPQASELIAAATRAVRRGANLNRTLLAFSRRQRLVPVAVDLNAMVDGLADMLRRTLGETVQVQVRVNAELPSALADPAQLEAALLNLAVNARDAMPDGGILTIETALVMLDAHYAAMEADVQPGRYLMLAVSDTGTGMSPEVVARAFEPFFTTKETGKGSGLGLAMVYGFIKQSGGHIKIYSEPGIGTTIKLFIPEAGAATPTGEETTVAPPLAQPRGHEKILVVEDEEEVRWLACRVLSELGYEVIEAADGVRGLALIEQHADIALLFTDVVLPGGINGPELSRRARIIRPALRVLYTSGYTGNAIQQLNAISGEVQLISKPYTIDELATTVRNTIDTAPASPGIRN